MTKYIFAPLNEMPRLPLSLRTGGDDFPGCVVYRFTESFDDQSMALVVLATRQAASLRVQSVRSLLAGDYRGKTSKGGLWVKQ